MHSSAATHLERDLVPADERFSHRLHAPLQLQEAQLLALGRERLDLLRSCACYVSCPSTHMVGTV